MDKSKYIVRYYHDNDFTDYLRLNEEAERWDKAGRPVSRASLREQLRRPGFIPEQHLLVAATNGRLLACIDITLEEEISRAVLDCLVHPAYRRMGLGTELFRRAIDLAGKMGTRRVHANIPESSHGARLFLEKLGFTPVRRYLEMHLESDEVPVGPDSGRDFHLKHLQPGQEEVLMRVQNCSFRESWGFNPNTMSDITGRLGMSDTSPENVVLVASGDEVMGYCWTTAFPGDDGNMRGRIHMMGVCTRYRGRGLGRELLLAGVRYLKQKGARLIELTVDSQNDPALRIYEAAGFEVVSASLWFEKDLSPGPGPISGDAPAKP